VVPTKVEMSTYVAGLTDPALFSGGWPPCVVTPVVPLPGGDVWWSCSFPKYAALTVATPFSREKSWIVARRIGSLWPICACLASKTAPAVPAVDGVSSAHSEDSQDYTSWIANWKALGQYRDRQE